MTEFIPGLQLSGLFYEKAVKPILDAEFPGLRHSAALVGYGSEVLGFDTERSSDHEWGPRLLLFLGEGDYERCGEGIKEALRWKLPRLFRGYSTHFGPTEEEGTRRLEERAEGPVEHKVEVHTVGGFLRWWLGFDPREGLEVADWLALPQQRLLEVTAGRVFYDGLGELGPLREKLAYYPRDVWLFLMGAQWGRIGQQEAFVGRTGEVGDEVGSRLIAASLVRDLMRLCFLMERKYAPYSKWFGTAFARLECAPRFLPLFERTLGAATWEEREAPMSEAYETAAEMHNALGITPPLETNRRFFFGRPFLVIFAERFVEAIAAAIRDPQMRALKAPFGSVDQISDSTDVLSYPGVYRKMRGLYE